MLHHEFFIAAHCSRLVCLSHLVLTLPWSFKVISLGFACATTRMQLDPASLVGCVCEIVCVLRIPLHAAIGDYVVICNNVLIPTAYGNYPSPCLQLKSRRAHMRSSLLSHDITSTSLHENFVTQRLNRSRKTYHSRRETSFPCCADISHM